MQDENIIRSIADHYDLILTASERRYASESEENHRKSIDHHHRLFNSIQAPIDPGCIIELGIDESHHIAQLCEGLPGTKFHFVDACPSRIEACRKASLPAVEVHDLALSIHEGAERAIVTRGRNGTSVRIVRDKSEWEATKSTGTRQKVRLPSISFRSFLARNKLNECTKSIKVNSVHLTKVLFDYGALSERTVRRLAESSFESLFVMCDEADPNWSSYAFLLRMCEGGYVPLSRSMVGPKRAAISFVKSEWKNQPVVREAMAELFKA